MPKMLSFRDTPCSKTNIEQELSRFCKSRFALQACNEDYMQTTYKTQVNNIFPYFFLTFTVLNAAHLAWNL